MAYLKSLAASMKFLLSMCAEALIENAFTAVGSRLMASVASSIEPYRSPLPFLQSAEF